MNNPQTEEEFESLGYKCRIVVGEDIQRPSYFREGHRCGYVGLPKDHIASIIGNCDDIPVQIHGGVTYAGLEDDGLFWVGFDCSHTGDSKAIWTFDNTKVEVIRLANRLKIITWNDAVEQKLKYMPEWFTKRVIIRK